MARECVVCMDNDEVGDTIFRDTPCGRHSMCVGCLERMFDTAMRDEKYYPPRCCSNEASVLLISEYEDVLPFELVWEYQSKEIGEYSVNAKYRVYCANAKCATFLHPETHKKIELDATSAPSSSSEGGESLPRSSHNRGTESSSDHDSESVAIEAITYAECIKCHARTCTHCKTLINDAISDHECELSEEDRKFEITVKEKGYQKCYNCESTIELIEACNHISCECGAEFCYICGEPWEDIHGCPHYGPAVYDDEGYNQDGFHRDIGVNRDGLTRQEQVILEDGRESGEEPDGESEEAGEADLPHNLRDLVRNGIMSFDEAIVALQMAHHQEGTIWQPQGGQGLGDQSEEESSEDEGSNEGSENGLENVSENAWVVQDGISDWTALPYMTEEEETSTNLAEPIIHVQADTNAYNDSQMPVVPGLDYHADRDSGDNLIGNANTSSAEQFRVLPPSEREVEEAADNEDAMSGILYYNPARAWDSDEEL
ncbi:hypothetical protein CC78DRAFT_569198 [Lojkania enalia]|uniref:RBR-type E3 ubiquitin transferase n=1 Tax=Lojkania enalia TaxID=147567 RepID=A0A9P4N5D2_9PLEO|nr:hypothetical protein CC78DRAFT_569198 [Didymosphaeria enalia]